MYVIHDYDRVGDVRKGRLPRKLAMRCFTTIEFDGQPVQINCRLCRTMCQFVRSRREVIYKRLFTVLCPLTWVKVLRNVRAFLC